MSEPRSGMPGHVWDHAQGYRIPTAALTPEERDRGARPVHRHGPLVCVNEGCGVFWPGTAPCTSETVRQEAA